VGINYSMILASGDDNLRANGWTRNEGHFEKIAKAGFDHVRIGFEFDPWTWNAGFLTADKRPNAESIRRLKWAIDNTINNGMVAIFVVSLHATIVPFEFEILKNIWEDVSEAFKDYPDDKLIFELLNEPDLVPGLKEQLETYQTVWTPELVRIIREKKPTRIIQIPGSWHLFANDPNLMWKYHHYYPFAFTHQDHRYPELWGTRWLGTYDDKIKLYEYLYLRYNHGKFLNTHHVNIGEWGTFGWDYGRSPLEDHIKYVEFNVRLFNYFGMSHTYFAFNVLYDDENTAGQLEVRS